MSETPQSIWSRPWRGPAKILAWFGLLTLAVFLVLCGIDIVTQPDGQKWDPLFMLLTSLILGAFLTGAILFGRWVACWRNFRRFLFGVACLLTLLALFYVEENLRGKHAWQSHRALMEAKGERFSILELAPPKVPDDKNFALCPLLKPALDFYRSPSHVVWRDTNSLARLEKISVSLPTRANATNQLVLGSADKGTFADLPACAAFYQVNTNYPHAPAGASPAEVVLTALGRYDAELKELREAAAARPECRFPVEYDYQPPWNILLPHLAKIKQLTLVTHVRATALLEARRPAEAFDDLNLGLRLSGSVRGEPILIDHLVRLASLGINLQTVREGLLRHAWSEAQLSELETNLAGLDLLAEYKLGIRGERALETSGLLFLSRQGLRGDPMYYLGGDEGAAQTTSPLSLAPRGWYYQNMLTVSELFEQYNLPAVDERAHRVYPDFSAKGQRAIEDLRRGPYTFFAKLFMPALQNAARKSAQMQTLSDATRVACALERYRFANAKLPDSLQALVPRFLDAVPTDVIDGKPLRYTPKPDGSFLLYSVGWNQTDDGGTLAWNHQKKDSSLDFTQGDWVWQMPAK